MAESRYVTKPFPTNALGVSFTGEGMKELTDVISERSPFRHYGLGNPCKVSTFEKEVREYFGCRFALALQAERGALLCAVAALG